MVMYCGTVHSGNDKPVAYGYTKGRENMGTRADFYTTNDDKMVWLGSIAWDGYPTGIQDSADFNSVKTEEEFIEAVKERAKEDDFTAPDKGWPWPWDDSNTTDYAYLWDGEEIKVSIFGTPWYKWSELYPEPDDGEPEAKGDDPTFPDMTDIKNVDFGKRSGIMIISR